MVLDVISFTIFMKHERVQIQIQRIQTIDDIPMLERINRYRNRRIGKFINIYVLFDFISVCLQIELVSTVITPMYLLPPRLI